MSGRDRFMDRYVKRKLYIRRHRIKRGDTYPLVWRWWCGQLIGGNGFCTWGSPTCETQPEALSAARNHAELVHGVRV